MESALETLHLLDGAEGPWDEFHAIGRKIGTTGMRCFNNLNASLDDGMKTPAVLFAHLSTRFGKNETDERVMIRLGRRSWQPGEAYHIYMSALQCIAEGSNVTDRTLLLLHGGHRLEHTCSCPSAAPRDAGSGGEFCCT